MSLPQQPPVIYPNTVTRQPPSHSDGSFGTVFIVLGVIVVISALACVFGRLCNRRFHHSKPKQNPAFRPKGPDIEFGKGIMPPAKPAGNGGAKPNGHGPFGAGEIRGEPNPAVLSIPAWRDDDDDDDDDAASVGASSCLLLSAGCRNLINYLYKSESGYISDHLSLCSFLVANVKHGKFVTHGMAWSVFIQISNIAHHHWVLTQRLKWVIYIKSGSVSK